jgi:hypothetical protein
LQKQFCNHVPVGFLLFFFLFWNLCFLAQNGTIRGFENNKPVTDVAFFIQGTQSQR